MKKFVVACMLFAAAVLGAPVNGGAVDKPAKPAASVASVNINTASAKELEKLPGIGRATAQNIVAFRNQNGKFSSPDDLSKVKGVGPKTMEKVRSKIVVK